MMSKNDTIIKMKSGLVSPAQAVAEFEKLQPKFRSGAAVNTRTYKPKPREARMEQVARDRALRKSTLEQRIPFISEALSDGFYLSQGLVLIGGVSGRGKSTLSSNILAGFINSCPDKTAVVISNEESTEAIYARTACVLLKYNFFDYQKGRMSSAKEQEVDDMIGILTERIDVVDDDAWDMTCLEDVQAVLEHAAQGNVGMALIDYFQTVAFSRTRPEAETFRVSKQFGLYLKDYGRKVGIPVVNLAQLKTAGKDSEIEFKDRVENDKTIYNHAFQAIEIVPDFEARQTKFIIHKDRFGYQQGHTIESEFVDGRFEPLGGL